MSGTSGVWQIDGPTAAKLQCGALEAFAQCDLQGIRFVPVAWNGRVLDAIEVLAGVGHSELDVSELYVRGADLVADFKHTGPDRIAPQVYWRATQVPRSVRV